MSDENTTVTEIIEEIDGIKYIAAEEVAKWLEAKAEENVGVGHIYSAQTILQAAAYAVRKAL